MSEIFFAAQSWWKNKKKEGEGRLEYITYN